MAYAEITGATPSELDEMWYEYQGTPKQESGFTFDEAYCLSKIQRQPDEYDGPDRYCKRRTAAGRTDYCPKHTHYENLSPTANMTHGVTALRKHLMDDFSELEEEAYEEIVAEWTEHYDLDDGADRDTVESMAISIIREIRADQVIENAERDMTTIRNVFGPEGELIDQEPEGHYLLDERRSIRNTIEKCKDNLNITRKRRNKHEVEKDRSGQLEAIAEGMDRAISDGEYDPSEFDE